MNPCRLSVCTTAVAAGRKKHPPSIEDPNTMESEGFRLNILKPRLRL